MPEKSLDIKRQPDRALVAWLFSVAGLVWLMIMLGGYTRLTQSGLSMVEWRPITGIFPPLSETAWAESFSLYQASPEFQKINFNMSLSDYQKIYYIEYFHRLLGRLIGLVYFIPLVIFWKRSKIPTQAKKHLLLLLFLGGLQGGLGWYMVKSGLVNNPHVSPYRLTLHLMMALLIYMGLLWVGFEFLKASKARYEQQNKKCYFGGWVLVGFCVLTIMSGGFMAGTRAGLLFPTFPKFGPVWIPENMYTLTPFWLNWFENLITIHFNHRFLALLLLLVLVHFCYHLFKTNKKYHKTLFCILILLGVQILLGAFAVLWLLPIPIALAHQVNAFLLLTVLLYLINQLKSSPLGLNRTRNKKDSI